MEDNNYKVFFANIHNSHDFSTNEHDVEDAMDIIKAVDTNNNDTSSRFAPMSLEVYTFATTLLGTLGRRPT